MNMRNIPPMIIDELEATGLKWSFDPPSKGKVGIRLEGRLIGNISHAKTEADRRGTLNLRAAIRRAVQPQ